MSCDNLGSFVLFLVDREISMTTDDNSTLAVRDVVKELVEETNQQSLYGRPKVNTATFLTAIELID